MSFSYEIEVCNPCEAIELFDSQYRFKGFRVAGTGRPFKINGGGPTYHALKLIAEFDEPLDDDILEDYDGKPGFSIKPVKEEAKEKSRATI